jgi:hypothetical protein
MIPSFTSRQAELRTVRCQPDRAGKGRFAAAAECETVHGRNYRLAQILDQVHEIVTAPSFLLGLDWSIGRNFVDVGAGDESLVARARKYDSLYFGVIPGVFETRSQVGNSSLLSALRTFGRFNVI